MSGRHPRAMRPRDERAHPVVRDALDKGYLDSGQPYVIEGFAGHEDANQARLAVNRAGMHLNVSTPCWVTDAAAQPCHRACADPQGPHEVHFRLHSKDQARRHVYAQSGGDPANLKYNPFARGHGPAVDDSGQRLA